MPMKYVRSQSHVPLHWPFSSALEHMKSLSPSEPRTAEVPGANAARKVVVDEPFKVPRMPAGICVFPPGLQPAIDVNSPRYVLAEQKRPGPLRHTRTARVYVSKAQLFPFTPVSTSFWTR